MTSGWMRADGRSQLPKFVCPTSEVWNAPEYEHWPNTRGPVLAVDLAELQRRCFEILPGLLIWATLIGLTVLAVLQPFAIAVVLILYDLYWLIRAAYIAAHLLASYRMLRRMRGIDWIERLRFLDDPTAALPVVDARIRDLQRQANVASSRATRRARARALWQTAQLAHDLRAAPPQRIPWKDVVHVVLLPTYQEPLELLQQSIDALAAADYPKRSLWVVVALEERAGPDAQRIARLLTERYAGTFGRFLTTLHPDGIPGERRVKSANATWAARSVQQLLDEEGIAYDRVLLSNFDADTVASRDYFGSLTYTFLLTPDRLRCSYQPLPLYHNNIWAAPAFSRVIATNSTFWLLIQSTRPERMVTFSSHAMPFSALVDVRFWDPAVVSDDSRIFWRCYIHYNQQYRAVPLSTSVSMDVTSGPTLWQSFVAQYKQNRRWAWGIENFPYIATEFLRRPGIPRIEALRRTLSMLEGFHSWATAPLILAALGWIPILFGGPEFQQTVLAFNLPHVTRTLLTIATTGLLVNTALTLLLLPPLPRSMSKRTYLWMAVQWLLVPLIAWTLGTLPVLDAATRLMMGKYLGFWVTPKLRVPSTAPVPALAVARRA